MKNKYEIKRAKFDGEAWFFVGITVVLVILSFANPDYVLIDNPVTMADWQAPSIVILAFILFTTLFDIKKVKPHA